MEGCRLYQLNSPAYPLLAKRGKLKAISPASSPCLSFENLLTNYFECIDYDGQRNVPQAAFLSTYTCKDSSQSNRCHKGHEMESALCNLRL